MPAAAASVGSTAATRTVEERPRVELRGRLVGLAQAPAAKLARVAQAPAGKVARVIQARADQLQQG